MSEGSGSNELTNVTIQLECKKEMVVTNRQMLPVNWNVRRNGNDVLRNVTSQLECRKEVVVTY
jgi:hypothetical protein